MNRPCNAPFSPPGAESPVAGRRACRVKRALQIGVHPVQRSPFRSRMALVLLCWGLMLACGNPPAPPPRPAANSATNRPGTTAGPTANRTNAEPAAPVRRVTFDPMGVGRDPFFPSTSRAPRKPATNAVETTAPARPQLPLSSYLKLTGLWPNGPRPLAYINKTDFRPGEQVTLTLLLTNSQNKLERKQVLVKCLEIRRESVLISVEGEPGERELWFR